MLELLTDKVAWVTGAGTGIGQAGAVALAKEGARVVLSGRRRGPLLETQQIISKGGGEAWTPIMDRRPEPLADDVKARMLRAEDLGEAILFVARLPRHVCLNELLISPTWHRMYVNDPNRPPMGEG